MQFISNIIVALLLTVSTSTATTAQKYSNLRGGGSNPEEEKAFSDPSPSGLSSIMNDDLIWDNCPGIDYKIKNSECHDGGSCSWHPDHQTVCWSVINQECYCN